MRERRFRNRSLSFLGNPPILQHIEPNAVRSFLDELDQLTNPKPGLFSADCPLHANKYAALTVRTKADDSVEVECLAGCDLRNIVEKLGLDPAIVISRQLRIPS